MKKQTFIIVLLALAGIYWTTQTNAEIFFDKKTSTKVEINSIKKTSAKAKTETMKKLKDYEKLWRKVDSLEEKGLPKSALEVVNKIYAKAKKAENNPQMVKAYIYRMKFRRNIEEKAFENYIFELERDILEAQAPLQQVMHSIAAEMYWMYYQQNRWKFRDRTETMNFENDDIETWTLNQLIDKTIKHYYASLENTEATKATDINDYNEILDKGSQDPKLRPTLFDFLMHRSIKFFQNSEISLNRPAEQFNLKEDIYFAEMREFKNANIQTKDTLSLHFHAITLMQRILDFNKETDNLDALIYNDVQRIAFVYSHSTNPKKEELYVNALSRIEEKYTENKYSAEASYLKAMFYRVNASKYNFLQKETFKYKEYNTFASNICKQVNEKFPGTNAANKCKTLKSQIETKAVSFQLENIVTPNANFPIRIEYRNVDKLYLKVLKIDRKKLAEITDKHYGKKAIEKIKKAGKEVYSDQYNLTASADYNSHSTEAILDGQAIGTYVIMLSTSPDFTWEANSLSYEFMNVTNLTYITRSMENHNEYYILDRMKGHAVVGATVKAYYSDYNYKRRKYIKTLFGTYTSDEKGHIRIDAKKKHSRSINLEIAKGDDFYSTDKGFHLSYYKQHEPYAKGTATLFTDRAIYRPGQTVFFKVLLISSTANEHELLTDFPMEVRLFDVNSQEISKQALTTNEFGTVSGSFDIPMGLLNGQMRISTSYGDKYIQVEEYKRPKFEVELSPFDGNYRLDDSLTVTAKAKAYSGAVISEAKVTYRITRKPIWRGWWSYYFNDAEVEIDNGFAETNEKGEVELKFKAIPDYTIEKSDFLLFNYQIKIDVTDLNGETQSTAGNISIGYKTLEAGISFDKKVDKDEFEKVSIYSRNMNGEFIPTKGNFKIHKLKTNPNLEREKSWARVDEALLNEQEFDAKYQGNIYDDENNIYNLEKEQEVFSGKFNTGKSKELSFSMAEWEQGAYVVEVFSEDNFGQEVSSKSFFKVFSKNTEKLIEKTPFWFTLLNNKSEPGDTAKFLIGSSYKDCHVLYELESQNRVIYSEWLNISEKQLLIKVPVHEADRGNLAVNIISIIYNRKHLETAVIQVPYTNKKLDIEFSTYRNKLFPGAKEEWILKIKDAKGEKLVAEMLATLYDASLDAFAVNNFYLNLYKKFYGSNSWNTDIYSVESSQQLAVDFNKYISHYSLYFDVLNWFNFGYYNNYYGQRTLYSVGSSSVRNGKRKKSMAQPVMAREIAMDDADYDTEEEMMVSDNISDEFGEEKSDKRRDEPGEPNVEIPEKKPVKVRTNFNETAFFYPNLVTNSKGEIEVKFTIPESLTKWKMLGFAHTKDLKFGTATNSLVTQKDLMVMPNAPRFFRENDKIIFPVKISNISKENLKGKVRLELFDAISLKPLDKILAKADFEKDFSVKAEGNIAVSWELKIPENVGLITYRVIAETDKFSDGEERPIPVLSNRMLVTESMPLPVRGSGTSEFEFEKLVKSKKSKSIKHHLLTLEFTSNPAWYAVQALPYMMEYPYECSEQTFSRYYANSIATHIANSSEKIKRVFDAWREGGQSKEALLSNLEKNQELKQVLLQETPWVLDAKNEGERKRRVGLLFDLNKMSGELQKALKKLKKEQKYNGGWSWFAGMPESRYITQHIVTGFGHLSKLGVENASDVETMKHKAVGFLDNEIKKEFKQLKKYYTKKELEDDHLSYMAVQYLYGRSFYPEIAIPAGSQEAFDYFFAQAKKYWLDRNQYGKGMIALALHRFDEKTIPQDIVKSLGENSITHEEMGMYWKANVSGYYWYQAPIETQALMIEVFAEVGKDQQAVNDLKVWLLKQKQTQDWKTTKATAEAVYALLLQGDNWLENDEIPVITLGGEVIDPYSIDGTDVEAGTGYFKVAWNGDEIKPKMGNVTVTKEDEGVAWGALYWQYFEDLDKITPHETPLKLDKKLFIERLTKTGVAIEPLTKKTKLVIGDKVIVRIELRVDRAMEYIHMKDMRASGFEPINVVSRYKYQGGLGYYESTKDAATNFFMDYLPKGTYVFEYPLRVTHAGDFANGITTIQCMYAPEFTSHSEGVRVMVND